MPLGVIDDVMGDVTDDVRGASEVLLDDVLQSSRTSSEMLDMSLIPNMPGSSPATIAFILLSSSSYLEKMNE